MTLPELSVGLEHYLAVSGAVFGIGIAIALSKRNAIAVLNPPRRLLGGISVRF